MRSVPDVTRMRNPGVYDVPTAVPQSPASIASIYSSVLLLSSAVCLAHSKLKTRTAGSASDLSCFLWVYAP